MTALPEIVDPRILPEFESFKSGLLQRIKNERPEACARFSKLVLGQLVDVIDGVSIEDAVARGDESSNSIAEARRMAYFGQGAASMAEGMYLAANQGRAPQPNSNFVYATFELPREEWRVLCLAALGRSVHESMKLLGMARTKMIDTRASLFDHLRLPQSARSIESAVAYGFGPGLWTPEAVYVPPPGSAGHSAG